MTRLRGITWDHPRGYAPLEALGSVDGIDVVWDRRSLQQFGDLPVTELADRYDLMIMDHPHIGMAAAGLRPLDRVTGVEGVLCGNESKSRCSYIWNGSTLALPVDAACQVSSWRPDILPPEWTPPTNWEEVYILAECLRAEGKWMGMALCPTDSLCSFLTLAAQSGVPPIERNWMPDEAVADVLEKLRSLYSVCHPKSLDWNPIRLYERMVSTNDVVYAPLAFGYTDYQRGGKLHFGPIPGRVGALLGGAGIAVSYRTPHPLAAEHIACVLAGRGYQTSGYVRSGGQPGHAAAWVDADCDACTGGFLSGTRRTLEGAWMRPREVEWPAFQEALGHRVHAYLTKGHETGETLRDLRKYHARFFQ